MKRRLICIALTLCMALSVFSASAYATLNDEEAIEPAQAAGSTPEVTPSTAPSEPQPTPAAPQVSEPVCNCENACADDAMNAACPVCGAEGATADKCAKHSAAPAPLTLTTPQESPAVTEHPVPTPAETEAPAPSESPAVTPAAETTATPTQSDEPSPSPSAEPENTPAPALGTLEYVQFLINALPDADSVTDDNRDDVIALLEAIDEARLALAGDADIDTLDFSKYELLCSALGEEHTLETLDGETLADLIANAGDGDTVTLYHHFYVSSTITIDKTLTLNLNGKEIKYLGESGSIFKVESGGNLTLTGNGQIVGGKGTNISGKENGNTYGGGVYVDGGTFTMESGTITGCSADYGGGVAVRSGRFTLDGGTITNCTANYYNGGGVFVYSGNFTMNNGAISQCSSTYSNGGGAYLTESDFTMTGGTISDCSAARECKAVYLEGQGSTHSFTMSGGTISSGDNQTSIIMNKTSMIPQGGTINGAVKINKGATVSLGESSSISPTVFNGAVSNIGTIDAGIYNGVVTNKRDYNNGTINGGTFNGGIVGGTVNIDDSIVETFNSDGGNPETQTLIFNPSESGTPAVGASSPIVDPNKEGHDFLGWYLTENGEVKTDDASKYTYAGVVHNESKTYTARWKVKQYSVTWDANGGTFGGSDKKTDTLNYGSNITPPTASPAKSATESTVYTFAGWYKGTEGGEEVKEFGTLGTADVTYYAHYIEAPRTYSISYTLDGSTNAASNPASYTYGEGVASFAEPKRTGYVFKGWVDESGKAVTKISETQSGNITLTAKWELASYTLSFNSNGGTDIAPTTATYGTVIDLTLAQYKPTRYGYIFTGWYTDTSFSTRVASLTLAENTTLVAGWTLNTWVGPHTGDESNIALYAALMGGSLVLIAGAAVIIIKKKKRK